MATIIDPGIPISLKTHDGTSEKGDTYLLIAGNPALNLSEAILIFTKTLIEYELVANNLNFKPPP